MQNLLLSFVFVFTGLSLFCAEQNARLIQKQTKHLKTLKQRYVEKKLSGERYALISNVILSTKNIQTLDSIITSLPLWDRKEAKLRIFHQQFEMYELSIPTYTALYQLICKAKTAEEVANIASEQIPGHAEWAEVRRIMRSSPITLGNIATDALSEPSERLAAENSRTISPTRTPTIINSHMLADALAKARDTNPRPATPPANLAGATLMISPSKS